MSERQITLDTGDGRQWIWKPEAGGWRVYRGHGDGGLYTEHVFTTEDMLEWLEEAVKP